MRLYAVLSLIFAFSFLPFDGRQSSAQNKPDKISVQLKPGSKKDENIRNLEKLIPRLMDEGDVPGLSIVLIKNGKISWHQNFGVKNVDTKEPIDDDTIFEAASLSKPVFAYAVMKLVDQGKLDLDTPLTKYLPEPAVPNDERADIITARMVLNHTTGFQNEILPGQTLKIYFTPGERFSYSGEGFLYLQKVIERLTDERFDKFMKRTVFEPLGMTNSGYLWQDSYETLMASGHDVASVSVPRIKPAIVKMSGLHTTILDYAKLVTAVMKGTGLKKGTTKQILKTQSRIDESCHYCLDRNPVQFSKSLSWGLGWGLELTGNREAMWHWGDNRGEFHTFALAYPKEKTGIVIFTNSGNGHSIIPEIVSEAGGGSHPIFAWMGYELYNSPAKTLSRDIFRRGDAAINQYRDSRKNSSGAKILNENQINSIGYWLLGKKKVQEAIGIFKLNISDFPNSANTYDSLAETYLATGEKELALKIYKKALEVNPNYPNAKAAAEIVKKLEQQ